MSSPSSAESTITSMSFSYSPADVAALNRFVMTHTRTGLLRLAVQVIAIVGSIFVGFPWFTVFVGLGVVTSVVLSALPSRFRFRGTTVLAPRTFMLDNDSIRISEAAGDGRTLWSGICRSEVVGERRFLFVSERQALILPDRAFDPADLSRLNDLIVRQVRPPDTAQPTDILG